MTSDERILRSAREEFVRHGIRRANVTDIARRAGISRVTVHRRFGDKAGLFRAVILADVAQFVERFDEVWYAEAPVATRVTDAAVLAIKQSRAHPLLTTLMLSEPEDVALQFTAAGGDEFQLISGLLAARLDDLVEREELAPLDTRLVAEAVLRLWYTFILIPHGVAPGEDDEAIQAFVSKILFPMLQLGVTALRGGGGGSTATGPGSSMAVV